MKPRKLHKDITTNTIFKQIQNEVIKKFGKDIGVEGVRTLASIPYQRLHDMIHNDKLIEGNGVRLIHIGKFHVKKGKLQILRDVKVLTDQGYTYAEARVTLRERWLEKINKEK